MLLQNFKIFSSYDAQYLFRLEHQNCQVVATLSVYCVRVIKKEKFQCSPALNLCLLCLHKTSLLQKGFWNINTNFNSKNSKYKAIIMSKISKEH